MSQSFIYSKSKNRCWYDEYKEYIEDKGFHYIFDPIDKIKEAFKRIDIIIEYLENNDHYIKSNSKDDNEMKIYNMLMNFRKSKRNNRCWKEDYQDYLNEKGYPTLFD